MRRILFRLNDLRRGARGQSVAEYAIVTFFLFMAGAGSVMWFWPVVLEAFGKYIKSFYFLLSLPIP